MIADSSDKYCLRVTLLLVQSSLFGVFILLLYYKFGVCQQFCHTNIAIFRVFFIRFKAKEKSPIYCAFTVINHKYTGLLGALNRS